MNYYQVLKNYSLVRKLAILQFIAYFGAWFSNVAIYTMLVRFDSSAFVISVVTAMHLIPAIIIAPLSGAIIDKFKIKNLMMLLLSVELLMTVLLLNINNASQIWLLMIFIFIRMACASIFFSSEMSLLPKIIKGKALQKANEIHSIIWSFSYAFGMAIGGIIVNAYGIKIAIILDSIILFIALIYFYNIDFKIEIIHTKEKLYSMIKDGFIYIKNHKIILHLILLHSSVGLTAFDTLITLLAKNEYKYIISVPLAIGLTNASRALALMIGPFFISNKINKDTLIYIFIFQAFSIILWSFLQFDFYYSLIAVFLTGLTTTTLWSYTYALLQDRVEKKYLGRVISYNDMIFMLSNVLTTLFIGIMASYVSLQTITISIGMMFFIVVFYYSRIKKWI